MTFVGILAMLSVGSNATPIFGLDLLAVTCVLCVGTPSCEAGCNNCLVSEATCQSCGEALCLDNFAPTTCVACVGRPSCEPSCIQCQVTEATCESCGKAECIVDLSDLPVTRQLGETCGQFEQCDDGLDCAFPPTVEGQPAPEQGICRYVPETCVSCACPSECLECRYLEATCQSCGVPTCLGRVRAQIGETCGGNSPNGPLQCAEGLDCVFPPAIRGGVAPEEGVCQDPNAGLRSFQLVHEWEQGFSSGCSNLQCTTESGGLEACSALCLEDPECNVFNFCPEGADCTSGSNRCCRRSCATTDALELTTRHRGWDVYIRSAGVSRDIPSFALVQGWEQGEASFCPNIQCTTESGGLDACSELCLGNPECNVFNFCPKGADCTSGQNRCCLRRCASLNSDGTDRSRLRLSSRDLGWDVYVRQVRAQIGETCGGNSPNGPLQCVEGLDCVFPPAIGGQVAPEEGVCQDPHTEPCNFLCYLNRYGDLRRAFGRFNVVAAKRHWDSNGRHEGRDCTCRRRVSGSSLPAPVSDGMDASSAPLRAFDVAEN